MNLPSGESIARQIVHGQRWFAEHFGVTCTEVWIPDVFGYPGSLPQIFAAGGMRRFVTQKLSWNRTNRFPHQTFWWEGIDGSRVLTHFPPVDTYGAEITPAELSESMERFAEHAWSDVSLIPYGYGDGGGGPTREMLARAARLADLDPMPHVELGLGGAVLRARRGRGGGRGAGTGVARRAVLRDPSGDADEPAAHQARQPPVRAAAPRGRAVGGDRGARRRPTSIPTSSTRSWREVLTQQFHDILPGSSIAWVHADAEEVFDRVAADLEAAHRRAASPRLPPDGAVVANAATFDRAEVVVTTAASAWRRPDAAAAPTAAPRRSSAHPVSGWRRSTPPRCRAAPGGRAPQVVVTDRSMANGQLAVSWALDGTLTSVIDVARGRELIPAGAVAAELLLAPDHPVQYDAWDLESWTVDASAPVGPRRFDRGRGSRSARRDRRRAAVVRPVLGGRPLRAARRVAAARRRDRPRLAARRAPAVDALPARRARRHGHVRHPVRRRAPADPRARRRGTPPSSRCAPIATSTSPSPTSASPCSTTGATATVCSAGCGAGCSLARAAKYPDPAADHGHHAVTLALLPHGPGLADVVAEAERLDLPLRVVEGGAGRTIAGDRAAGAGRDGDRSRRRGRRRQGRRRRQRRPRRAPARGDRQPGGRDGGARRADRRRRGVRPAGSSPSATSRSPTASAP